MPSESNDQSNGLSGLSLSRLITASIRHNCRVSLSVVLGVATATAVITGALLVGDSMRGSLRDLTVQRLGKTESVVMPGHFFQADGIVENAIPLIYFSRGVVETRVTEEVDAEIRRAGSIQVLACDESFWDLDISGVSPKTLPNNDGVVLNQSAADELGVQIGDLVTVRLPSDQAVPADSPLGRRDIQSEGIPRMEVLDILPDRGIGRFALAPSQAAPMNVYLDREVVADVLDRIGQANMLLFDAEIQVEDLDLDLNDLGLNLERKTQTFESPDGVRETIFDYYSLTSDQLLLPDIASERIQEQLQGQYREVTTYLANAIEKLDENGEVAASVPYSTISALDSSPQLPLNYAPQGNIDPSVIPMVLNSWIAERLDADIGTSLRVAYYEPEVEAGQEIERFFDAVVTEIVPITKPATRYRRNRVATFDSPPTIYNDPHLTPDVPGVTDQESISDWDLPFALERKISNEDDVYWNEHRLTPKAFLPLAQGEKLFGSRFGTTTSLRIDLPQDDDQFREQVRRSLDPVIAELGWQVRPLRQQQLSASRGTTPFDALFLALSFFVIFAAVLLIAMLFRLGLAGRLKQFGTLLAVGWTPRRVSQAARYEGFLIAVMGVIVGLALGILYASGVLWALRSLWVGAVTVPFLRFHWSAISLVIGGVSGWFVAAVTLAIASRTLSRISPQNLLAGRDGDEQGGKTDLGSRYALKISVLFAVLALACAGFGASSGGQAAAGGFVGGGMMLLLAVLMAVYSRFRKPQRIGDNRHSNQRYSLGLVASRNATRHPLRSTLTIGLMASASFLIIAISAFRLEPTDRGTGGFDLIAQSAQPFYRDLGNQEIQSGILGPDRKYLAGVSVTPIRLRLGQDASCNNLYQATRPTVWGLPTSFSNHVPEEGFDWLAHDQTEDGQSPWTLLNQPASGASAEQAIPMVIDQNTAMYSLQMYGGIGEIKSFEYEEGKPVYFRVAGLLANSLLQGRLMIGNDNFESVFDDVSGFQQFLLDCGDQDSSKVATVLENRLGDIGMDVSDTKTVLSGLLAVQNTYLRTFQSLGALGLLLGTIGLAVSQIRSVLERRRELGVLRAIGFTRWRLASMVMRETVVLLIAGIGCGVICAILSVLPHALVSHLDPPVLEPLLIVAGILAFGLLAGFLGVMRVVRMPLIESLRSE